VASRGWLRGLRQVQRLLRLDVGRQLVSVRDPDPDQFGDDVAERGVGFGRSLLDPFGFVWPERRHHAPAGAK